jgi:hypothetical protein
VIGVFCASKTGYNRVIAMKKIRKIVLKKKAYKLFLLYLCLFFPYACIEFYSYSEEDLYGTWIGNKGEFHIVLSFSQDSSFEMKFNQSDSIKGTFEVDFSKTPIPLSVRNIPSLTFEVDFSKTPIPLSVRNIPSLQHPLHTIIQFKDPNTIIMGEFASRLKLRPITFNPDEIIIFTRSDNP